MHGGDHGCQPEPKLEAERDVDEGQDEGEQDGQGRLLLEFPSDFRTHGLGPDHLEHVPSERRDELAFDLPPHRLHLRVTEGSSDDELVLLPEARDGRRFRAPEGRAQLSGGGGLVEPNLDERSAREVDAVVLPIAYGEDVGEHRPDP